MAYTITRQNLDGQGVRPTRTYRLAPAEGYWPAVTDVPCPVESCVEGVVRWAEAGYVPGYRICDTCGRHYLAGGRGAAPVLYLMAGRRGQIGSGIAR